MANNELVLSFSLPGLNEIIKVARGNKYASAKQKKKYTHMVEAELYLQECIPDEPFQMIDIEFTWTEKGRGRDPDNIRAGAKFVLDAMVNRGIIPDDSLKYVKILADKFRKGKERGAIVQWTTHKEEATPDTFKQTIQGFIENLEKQTADTPHDEYFTGMKNAYRYALAIYEETI